MTNNFGYGTPVPPGYPPPMYFVPPPIDARYQPRLRLLHVMGIVNLFLACLLAAGLIYVSAILWPQSGGMLLGENAGAVTALVLIILFLPVIGLFVAIGIVGMRTKSKHGATGVTALSGVAVGIAVFVLIVPLFQVISTSPAAWTPTNISRWDAISLLVLTVYIAVLVVTLVSSIRLAKVCPQLV